MGAAISVTQPSELPASERSACLPGEGATLEGVIELLRSGKARQVVCLCGAGISVSAGIPDFRTPGTGLYDQLARFKLPRPEAIFDLDFFGEHPSAFCTLAKEMLPGQQQAGGGPAPTPAHAFLRLLQVKGLLRRCYTQNIDTLERLAGVAPERLVEAHGSFADCHCVQPGCGAQYALQTYRDAIEAGTVPRCAASVPVPPPPPCPTEADFAAARAGVQAASEAHAACDVCASSTHEWMLLGLEKARAKSKLEALQRARDEHPAQMAAWEAGPRARVCGGLVKADIVFFGESVRLGEGYEADLAQADLCIIMGTSLQVMPFAGLIGRVPPLCPRVLINRELVGQHEREDTLLSETKVPMGFGDVGLRVGLEDNYRDVFLQGDCDDGVRRICDALNWTPELNKLLHEMQNKAEPGASWQALVDQQPLDENRCETLLVGEPPPDALVNQKSKGEEGVDADGSSSAASTASAVGQGSKDGNAPDCIGGSNSTAAAVAADQAAGAGA